MSCGSLEESAGPAAAELSPAEASRKRIAECGGRWYRVLNVSICATWEEVKTAHKKLVLLHHPDKGGDPDTFRLVHAAYDEAQKKCMKQKVRMGVSSSAKKAKGKGKGKSKKSAADTEEAKAAAKADAESKEQERERLRAEKEKQAAEKAAQAEAQAKAKAEAKAAKDAEKAERIAQAKAKAEAKIAQELEKAKEQAGRGKKRARPKPIAVSASRAKLASAMERLEQMDPAKKTMPEDIPLVSPEQVAAWINAGTCAPVDTREDHEQEQGDGPAILGAVPLKYSQVADVDLLKDVASPQVSNLQQLQEQGKHLVLFSCAGTTYDKCYLVASYLLDLFGFNPDLIFRMEGGHNAWKAFMGGDTGADEKDDEDADMGSATAKGEAEGTETVEEKKDESQSAPAQAASTGSSSGGEKKGRAALRADYILTTARDAHDKAMTQLALAKKELAEHDNLMLQINVLETGTWESEEERKAHVDNLWPILENNNMEASLLDLLANAVAKPPGERGFMDQMALKEVGKRFAEQAEKFRAALRLAADAASERGRAVQEAETQRHGGVHTSTSAAIPGRTADSLGQWTLIGEMNALRRQRQGGSP